MAYGNYYAGGYNPYYYQQPQAQPQQQQQSDMIWVQGEAGARSYMVAPNCTIPLWDSEKCVIYLKSSDSKGVPSMRIIDYTIRDEQRPQAFESLQDSFATKQDINALSKQYETLKGQLDALKEKLDESNIPAVK